MPIIRSSREIAQRVDLKFHERRNRFRRLTWFTALLAGVGCAVWLTTASLRGKQQIYEPGPLSTPHQMLRNDCSKCHDKWAAWQRLSTLSDDVRSIPNRKCVVCHGAAEHQANQIPPHEKLNCSVCHAEHRGDVQLTHIPDQHCTECHSDLKQHGGSAAFALNIDSFDGSYGKAHPEFILHDPRTSSERKMSIAAGADRKSIEYLEASVGIRAKTNGQNPDVATIFFNHKVHLAAQYDFGNGDFKKREAFEVSRGRSLDCDSCHQFDASGRYMLPIRYEQHCAKCHPLLFDNVNHSGQSVPHGPPSIVRGFLTERYTLAALKRPAGQPDKPETALNPGIPYRGLLTEESAQEVDRSVLAAEKHVLRHMHTLFGWEAQGGCRYCHTVVAAKDDKTNWAIVPPEIPDRWYPHSRFRHSSHRMLDCNSCHRDFSQSAEGTHVAKSEKTADVLMPPIGICLNCHTSQPVAGNFLSSAKSFTGARTNCVECHTYHKRDGSSQLGTLGLDLQPTKEHRRQEESIAR